jgi:hypothetical protein
VARSSITNNDYSSRRWLCSHLVELVFDSEKLPPRAALLEEIDAQSAAIGVECPYPVGTMLKIKAGDVEIPAQIVVLLPRETDFLIWAQFAAGHSWSPDAWKPDHLYLPPKKKKLRRAAGQGG